MSSWEQRLSEQVERDWKNYHTQRIPLDTARADLGLSLTGDFLYVAAASSASALATVKLNRNTNQTLDLRRGTEIKTIFTQLFVTNTAQSGEWIDLVTGVNFEKIDLHRDENRAAQAVVEITNGAANTNQAGADQVAERVVILAAPQNTDIAWVDFGQAAVQDSCYPLEPGDSVTVMVPNLDQINVNFEVGGESVWIINEI